MVREISKSELESLVAKGANLIDVRESQDQEGLPGNKHLPLSRLSEDHLNQVIAKGDDPIIFYCRSGVLSSEAAMQVSTWNKKEVFYLAGGLLGTGEHPGE